MSETSYKPGRRAGTPILPMAPQNMRLGKNKSQRTVAPRETAVHEDPCWISRSRFPHRDAGGNGYMREIYGGSVLG